MLLTQVSLQIIDEQICAPTSADLLADVTAHAIHTVQQQNDVFGLCYLLSVISDQIYWYGYAKFLIDFARQASVEIKTVLDALSLCLPVPFILLQCGQ